MSGSTLQSKGHDNMVLALTSGTNASTALLTAVKNYLDANYSAFKGPNGFYSTPHVIAAMNAVKNRGT